MSHLYDRLLCLYFSLLFENLAVTFNLCTCLARSKEKIYFPYRSWYHDYQTLLLHFLYYIFLPFLLFQLSRSNLINSTSPGLLEATL